MSSGPGEERLRVLLVCKTLAPARSGAWRTATAPWALGAFSLQSYLATRDDLRDRVEVVIRSFPADAAHELVLDEVLAVAPDVVGFTVQPWNYADTVALSRLVKRLMPGVAVWHGGPTVVHRRAYLAHLGPETVDLVVEGEGELPFAELCAHRLFGLPALDAIAGVGWFDADGALRVTPDGANPDVSLLPPVMTADNLGAMGSYVLYECSRGCPFRCSFCNWGSQKAKLRSRDRGVIERDLAAILARPEVTHLWITDAGLDLSVEHVLFLADCIRRHRRHPVHVSGYVFLLHRDLSYVSGLVGAFDTLQLGLQTANEHVLSEMGRKALSVERFDRILDVVLPHFPDLRVDLLYGLPNIGPSELRDSVRFLLDKGIWLINLYRLVAIPGTEMGDEPEKYGIVAAADFPFSVYESQGVSARDLFEMQQFKVNLDTLRALFADGAQQKARAAGLDLVDFASRLHELVPRFNFLTDYGLEMDRDLDPELVTALRAAAEAYTSEPAPRGALHALLDHAYGVDAATGPRREPTALSPPASRAAGERPPPALPTERPSPPSDALRGLTAALAAGVGGFREPFTPEEAREAWLRFREQAFRPARVGVHVHVPFCETICTYCDCATEAVQGPEQVARYLDYLDAELAFFDGVVGEELDRLYVGGGTPNLLREAELERMLAAVNARHRFAPDAVRCLEGHPVHSTREKLDVARAAGINRVSFGVQSADAAVLRRVNRGDQTPAHVERAVRDAFAAGIPEVNLDFIHGLGEASLAAELDALGASLALAPSTLCIQLLNDSHFASPYRDVEHRRLEAASFRELGVRLADWIAGRAPAYEIDFRPDTIVVHRRDLWRDWRGHLEDYSARDRVWRSTLGYGRHAQSTLHGSLVYQNQERTWRFDPKAPIYAARRSSLALECASDLVAELERTRTAGFGPLRTRYGGVAMAAVEAVVVELVGSGHLEGDGESVRDLGLAPEAVGWLVRRLLPSQAPSAEEARPIGGVRVADNGQSFRIRLEPERAGARYFGVARGVGLYYQAAEGAELDDGRTGRIMSAVVRHADELIARGVAQADLPRRIADFLEARLGRAGIRARVEDVAPRPRRLTVVAPG